MTSPLRALPGVLLVLAIALLLAIPVLTGSIYVQGLLILTFLMAILASGWNVMSGLTGYISLGHSVFIGLGAYAAGIAAERWDVSPFLVAPLGGALAAATALLLSLITRRTRGAAFVIISFAFLELMSLAVRNFPALTNGSQGLLMPLPTWDVTYQYVPFYYSLLLLLVLSVALAAWLKRSRLGLGLVAIRDDEDKAAGVGVATGVYKGIAFAASAVLVGTAGSIYGYYVGFLDPGAMFDIVLSVEAVLAVLIGGRGTVWGPVLGSFILVPLADFTNSSLGGADAGALRLIFFGGLLLLVVLLLPRGAIPEVARLLKRRASRDDAGLTGSRLMDLATTRVPTPANRIGKHDGSSRDALLAIRGVSKRFGAIQALDGCSFEVRQGSITGLIGPNGSGKTTLFNLIDGTYPVSQGSITLAGRDVTRLSPTARTHAGIGRTYQHPRLFGSLTVLENIAVASSGLDFKRILKSGVSGAEAARAMELLEFVGLQQYAHVEATDLSYGQSKLVELTQVLMLEPQLIMLDEPAAGLNPQFVERIKTLIRRLNEVGYTFVVVEHDMNFVLSLCDPVVVLSRGKLIANGDPLTVSATPEVQEAYLGDDFVPVDVVAGGGR